jgi:ABC-type branched-subunit amino acid transport system ATPase component
MPKKAKAAEPAAADVLGPRPRLVKLIIKNFRCIGPTPVTIDLDDIVVLVGPNNVGKSSVLKAYEGGVLSIGQRIRNLGVKTKKPIPSMLIDGVSIAPESEDSEENVPSETDQEA